MLASPDEQQIYYLFTLGFYIHLCTYFVYDQSQTPPVITKQTQHQTGKKKKKLHTKTILILACHIVLLYSRYFLYLVISGCLQFFNTHLKQNIKQKQKTCQMTGARTQYGSESSRHVLGLLWCPHAGDRTITVNFVPCVKNT